MDLPPSQELPAPPPSVRKRRLHGVVATLLWLALSAVSAALGAWLIAAPVTPRSWESLVWPCFLWTLVANILFFTLNILEGGIIFFCCVVVAALSIGAFQRFGVIVPSYVALVALIGGFISSRVLYARLS